MARSTYDDFVIRDKLGSGSYGTVWKAIRKVDKQTYAMKEIDLNGMTRKEQEECIKETQVLASLDSEFIIKYYDSFLEKGKLFIVTEYASNGNLHDFVKRQKANLAEDLIWKLFFQMLLGLHHMHKRKILHRDFKTLNVFLDAQLNVKLGDLGVAKILTTQTNFAKTIVGTPYYLSPELCEDKPYNEKSDMWALGVVLYECCTQRHPFDGDNQGALILKILRGRYPPVSGYSKDLTEIIKACLTLDMRKRPDTERLLGQKAVRDKAAELGVALPPAPAAAKPVTVGAAGISGPDAGKPGALVAPRKTPSSLNAASVAAAGRPGAVPASRPRPSSAAEKETAAPARRVPSRAPSQAALQPKSPPAAAKPPAGAKAAEAAPADAFKMDDMQLALPEDLSDSERAAQIRKAIETQKAACIQMIGARAFDAVYMLVKMKSDSSGAEDMNALTDQILKIIPQSKIDAAAHVFRMLCLEGQLDHSS